MKYLFKKVSVILILLTITFAFSACSFFNNSTTTMPTTSSSTTEIETSSDTTNVVTTTVSTSYYSSTEMTTVITTTETTTLDVTTNTTTTTTTAQVTTIPQTTTTVTTTIPQTTTTVTTTIPQTTTQTTEATFSTVSNLNDIDYSGYSNYYSNIESSTNVITDMAHLLRNTIHYVTYGDARYVYRIYDNGSQVVLYDVPTSSTYRMVPATGEDGWGSGGYITYPVSVQVNREHVWACSDMRIMPTNKSTSNTSYVGYNVNDGSFDYRPDNNNRGHYSDLVNLWNSLASPNFTHSDHFFGEELGSSVGPYLENSIFYPGDEYKGDIARILFYMTLMYPHLTLVNEGSSYGEGSIYYGYLNVLLEWNAEDPVSDYEIARNDLNYSEQGNRNPFVDFYYQNFAELMFASGDPEVSD